MSYPSLYLLSLGDSYTVGEGVAYEKNFPSQLVQLAAQSGLRIELHLIAKTGWTTSDLIKGVAAQKLRDHYSFVTLLIGVNNQYQQKLVEDYAAEFDYLLQRAIGLVNRPSKVFVLSIPDWSVTPFARERDIRQISHEIDLFNVVNRELTTQRGASYFYITDWTREAAADSTLITSDGLHPSGKEYRRWAEQLFNKIKEQINADIGLEK